MHLKISLIHIPYDVRLMDHPDIPHTDAVENQTDGGITP
jgi:hypothetical protein